MTTPAKPAVYQYHYRHRTGEEGSRQPDVYKAIVEAIGAKRAAYFVNCEYDTTAWVYDREEQAMRRDYHSKEATRFFVGSMFKTVKEE